MSKVSPEVALNELKGFLQKYKSKEFRRNRLPDEKIKEDYIDVLEAIEDGYLTINENKVPTYTLQEPLGEGSEDQDLVTKEITLRSRVKAVDKALLMDGINIEKQQGTYAVKLLSYVCDLSTNEVKKLGSEDFVVLSQLCSVF